MRDERVSLEPREFPVLFSGALVRAILNTKVGVWPPEPIDPAKPFKSQTRRLGETWAKRRPGDRAWCKETWCVGRGYDGLPPRDLPVSLENLRIHYLADGAKPNWAGKTRVSIHMVRRASRLLLEVISTRQEPLRDISEEDARAEGFPDFEPTPCLVNGQPGTVVDFTARGGFCRKWQSLHGSASWDANPIITAITFMRIA